MVTTMFHANGSLLSAHSHKEEPKSKERTSSTLVFLHGSFLFLLGLLIVLAVLTKAAGAGAEKRGDGDMQTLYVGSGGEYPSIQEAIDHAASGDLIVQSKNNNLEI